MTLRIPSRFASRVRVNTEREIRFGMPISEYRRLHVHPRRAMVALLYALAIAVGAQALLSPPAHLPLPMQPDGPPRSVLLITAAGLAAAGLLLQRFLAPTEAATEVAPDAILDLASRTVRSGDGTLFCTFCECDLVIHVLGQSLDEALHHSNVTVHEEAEQWCLYAVDRSDPGEPFPRHRYLLGDGRLGEIELVGRQLLRKGFRSLSNMVARIQLGDGRVIDSNERMRRDGDHVAS